MFGKPFLFSKWIGETATILVNEVEMVSKYTGEVIDCDTFMMLVKVNKDIIGFNISHIISITTAINDTKDDDRSIA